jgi:hypothetical protein
MTGTPRRKRAAATAATRRWRDRQARQVRLVTVEVGQAALDRLVVAGLIPAAGHEDSTRLGVILSQLLESAPLFAGQVTGHGAHGAPESLAVPANEAGDPVTAKAGEPSCNSKAATKDAHLQKPACTAQGCWRPGTSGNPRGRAPGTKNQASQIRDLIAELWQAPNPRR